MWKYIDLSGEVVIEVAAQEVGVFREGRAPVRRNDLWGIIDAEGQWVAEPQFIKVSSHGYTNGYCIVALSEDEAAILNRFGEIVQRLDVAVAIH